MAKLTLGSREALNWAPGSYSPSITSRTMTARAEFNKGLIKKCDEDLNTTLIFVRGKFMWHVRLNQRDPRLDCSPL
jgi:hypothetical protein